jgi:CubicO group peptidase (beta-lactamase class C family)
MTVNPRAIAMSALFGWILSSAFVPASQGAEPLRLHPENPHYVLFRGKPTVLVASTEHYGAVLNGDFDFRPYLDELQAAGLNYTRVFTGVYCEPWGQPFNTLNPPKGRLLAPWARSETPGFADGGNKFDLSRWDDAYFKRLRDFIAEASKRGVVVEVTLFCNDETGFDGAGDLPYRRQGWKFLLSGGGLYDNLDWSFSVTHPNGKETRWDKRLGGGSPALRRQLGILRAFLDGFELTKLRPDKGVVRGGAPENYSVLAEPGKQYAVSQRAHKVRLSLPIGLVAVVLGVGTAKLSPEESGARGKPGPVEGDPEATRSAAGFGQDGLDGRDERSTAHPCVAVQEPFTPRTRVSLRGGKWCINDEVTNRGTRAEGLLMNVRMVNSVFEDRHKPDRDPEASTDRFLAHVPDYAAHGVNAFTLCLQGGMPGYEGALNSAFEPDGSLRESYLARTGRVVEACDRNGLVVILGCFYQRQDQVLADEAAVRAGAVNVASWIRRRGFRNVVLEIANEFDHGGFNHRLIRTVKGQIELIRLAKRTAPALLVSTSGLGHGRYPDGLAGAADFILIHFNGTTRDDIPARIAALKRFGKPIVCNEDEKVGEAGARAAELCAANGASWGLMAEDVNQHYPFTFKGAGDDPVVYAKLKELTSPQSRPNSSAKDYFPPPESEGGWRKLDDADSIRHLAGMDPGKLEELRQWLRQSDRRKFAAVVTRRGYIVLEEERGNSSVSDASRVASCSKAICATVLSIASEQSRQGRTPQRMAFDDRAFDFIPWAQPLSDPRKATITVKQLLNHTSGLCPEATGAPNDGSWEFILGHSGDARTERLAFDPGTACGYSTHALAHAALVCETVTGKPYDQFAIEALFKPLGVEHWSFQYYEGGPKYGRHPSHGLGMPARDMARIAYCMAHGGRWKDRQVIPEWFVEETTAPTHDVHGREMRFKINARTFSHGWELPARLTGEGGRSGRGIPADARTKPGSGGQLIAFVPSLDLVVTRQTGSSGDWQYEEFLRRACAAVVDTP